MYVLALGLENILEEMGVDVGDFKMDVRKRATFGSHASVYGPNIGLLPTSILD